MTTISWGRLAVPLTAALCLAGAAYADPAADPPSSDAPIGDPTTSNLQPPYLPRMDWSQGPFAPLSDKLATIGISLRGQLIDQFAQNTEGGIHQGGQNVGQLNFGADIDLDKLIGIPGGSFHTTIYRDYGYGLNVNDTGTFVKQQNDYKNAFPQLHLGLFGYEQKLFDNKIDIIVGRLGTTPFYGHLVPACSFQNGATCGVPAILNSEAGFSLLPSATWGGNVTYRPVKDFYFETGTFEVNPFITHTDGLDWSTSHATGITIPVELAWARPSLKEETYPFEVKIGGYDSTAPHSDVYFNSKGQSIVAHGGTAQTDPYRDGVYAMADKVVWRPDRDTTENLNLFGGIIQPLEEEEITDQEIYGGMLLTGAIPGRPNDSIGFEGTYFNVSPREIAFLDAERVKLGNKHGATESPNEGVLELNYGLELVKNLRVTPNIQYIINPDNAGLPKTTIVPKNILAFGVYMNLNFGGMLGFSGSAGSGD